MFFLVSKLLAIFIHPLTYIALFLVLASAWYHKPEIGRTCVLLACGGVFLFGTPVIPHLMTRFLETRYPRVSPPPHVDAIVVLAGMVALHDSTPEHIEFGEGVDRILTGMTLFKEGYGDILLLAGGSGELYEQGKSESRFLRHFAVEFGIPEERILIEPDSRNTHENAVNTVQLMKDHHISTIILVTSASHLPRAMGCFRKLGVEPIPYGVDWHSRPQLILRPGDIIPDVGHLQLTSYILHEYVGLLMYKFAGYI